MNWHVFAFVSETDDTMVAERIQLDHSPQARQQALLALFAEEMAAESLVARLPEFDVDMTQVSVLRIALGHLPVRIPTTAPPVVLLSSRYATIGVCLGCFVALLIGLLLYATNFLQLSFLEALLVHTLALVILGGVIGGAIGAIWASVQEQKQAAFLLPQSTDGFLVVMKVAPHLLARCEALARELGAHKFLS